MTFPLRGRWRAKRDGWGRWLWLSVDTLLLAVERFQNAAARTPTPNPAPQVGGESLGFRLALRRGHLAGAGAEDETSDNPDRDLVEDDAEEEAEEKNAASGELVHGGEDRRLTSSLRGKG